MILTRFVPATLVLALSLSSLGCASPTEEPASPTTEEPSEAAAPREASSETTPAPPPDMGDLEMRRQGPWEPH